MPAHGLHFPLSLTNENNEPVTRTLLAINREEGSLTYAGDIGEKSKVRLMKASSENLIKVSQEAIHQVTDSGAIEGDMLAFAVSCVGRRLVLDQLTEDECEMKSKSKKIFSTGFYSYGEINKSERNTGCSLHNQSFTITTMKEIK